MDSSSLPSPMPVASANRDPSADDKRALSVASALAKEAAALFESGKYTECLTVLHQLLEMKGGHPKILHNIAIAENFQEESSDPKKLLGSLNDVKKQSEELARASSEEVESASVGVVTGNKGSNNVPHQLAEPNNSVILYSDEYDISVAMYNIAVTWFHLHEYAKSFSILEALYQNIQPIDEGTALHICHLLLDVALMTHHAARATEVISYVEKVFCVSNIVIEGGSSAQQKPSALFAKSTSLPSNSTAHDASTDSACIQNTIENSLSRTLSEEALEDESLQLLTDIDIGGENLPRPSSLRNSNGRPRAQADESISSIDLRLKLHLYKVRLLLLLRNYKAAKREVKMAMNTARGKDYTLALYLKSHLEYARGNHRKAIKLLVASSNRTELAISSLYFNNLGCIYYRLGKYHTSAVFFSKSLRSSSLLRKEKPSKLSAISLDKSLLIVYNCGLQQLACKRPLPAFRSFYKASVIFYNRPLLWLRIAECCLLALEKGLLKSSASAPLNSSEVKVRVIGKGKWRQLVVEDGFTGNGKVNFVGREELLGDDKQPNLSMPLARQCLLNALILISGSLSKYSAGLSSDLQEKDESREDTQINSNYKESSGVDSNASNVVVGSGQLTSNGEVKEQKGGNNQNAFLINSMSDYKNSHKKENQMIEQALLADLAYVELELGNPMNTLYAARSLLRLQDCSKIYIFLGNIYAAEALCLLNRPKEAAEHLSMYVSGENGGELPYSQQDLMWRVDKNLDSEEPTNGSTVLDTSADEYQGLEFLKPEEARGTILANVASVHAVQGDLEMARQLVTQALSLIPNSREAILIAIYVDLMCGKTQEALSKLRRCNHVKFLPGSLALNGS